MEKNEQINVLTAEINELLSGYYCPESPQMLEMEKGLIISSPILAPLHDQSYYLFNLNKSLFTSANSIHENKLLKPAIYANKPLTWAELSELIHPDNLIFSLKFVKAAIQFLLKLPLDRAKEFSIGYTIRLMTKANVFEYFSIRFKVVVCNESGKPWLLMMHCKLCPLIQLNKDNLYRIVSIEPFDLIRKSRLFNNKKFTYLTPSEKEVVKDVNNGFQKKEIALKRKNSPNTIKTHFRHIAEKSGISHIHQACLYITKTGIMSLLITFYNLLFEDLPVMDLLVCW